MNKNRYARNILINDIGQEGQEKISSLKVFVAGAGGLGSSVISNLACLGVKAIGIIDFDVIDITNLNRQFMHKTESVGTAKIFSAKRWINELNPNIEVETYNKKLDTNNTDIKNYDIVADCFDNWESKFLLNKLCVANNIPLIHAGVEGYKGQVMTILPGQSACLECILSLDKMIDINRGIIAPTVNIIGSVAAKEIMNFSLGKKLLTDTILRYDINENSFKTTKISKNRNCTLCSKE